jgi:hypothetical protein
MSTARIICPKCHQSVNLPAQLEVMMEVHRGGGGYIAFGDPDRRLGCPSCGHGIRVGDIIEGKHNPKRAGWLATLFNFAFLAAIVLGVLYACSR